MPGQAQRVGCDTHRGSQEEISSEVAHRITARAVARIERFWAAARHLEPTAHGALRASGGAVADRDGRQPSVVRPQPPKLSSEVAELYTSSDQRSPLITHATSETRPVKKALLHVQKQRVTSAATRIQRLWRRYRDAVDAYDSMSAQNVADASVTTRHIVAAAFTIQQRWRHYRSAVSEAANSADGAPCVQETQTQPDDVPPDTSPKPGCGAGGSDGVATPATPSSSTAPAANDAGPPPSGTAATTIQLCWRRYRRALRQARSVNEPLDEAVAGELTQLPQRVALGSSSPTAKLLQENRREAAMRIEESWRSYEKAIAEAPGEESAAAIASCSPSSSEMDDSASDAQDSDFENIATALALEDVLGREFPRGASAASSSSKSWHTRRRPELSDGHRMANDGVLPLTGMNRRGDIDDAEDRGRGDNESDLDERFERLFLASVSSGGRAGGSRRSTSQSSGVFDGARGSASSFATVAGVATPSGSNEDAAHAAALVIQRFYYRWIFRTPPPRGHLQVRTRVPLHQLDGRDLNGVERALAVLQHRFRFNQLRRRLREQDQEAAVRRVQELWRRRREIRRHFHRLQVGRRDVAARRIQDAFRISRRQGPEANPGGMSSHAAHGPLTPSERSSCVLAAQGAHEAATRGNSSAASANSLPLCIVCLVSIVQVALLPCGHAQMCAECAGHLRRCPVCRRDIALQLRIYL